MHIFDTILVYPIINLLLLFYHGLTWLHVPFALGFSIILMTVFIRLLLYPITAVQLKATKKMQEMTPHLNKIKEKHKGDMKRQQQATMELYKEHGVNPAAGCLPALLQIVILLFGLYPALQKILTLHQKETVAVINKIVYAPFLQLNHVWDTHFFGFPLAQTPGQLFASMGLVVLLIPLFTGIFQFIQSKMMITPADPKDKKPAKKEQMEDFAATFQKQSLYLLPVMIGVFAWNFSIGLSLYWNTFTIFGIIQQYKIQGWGGLEPWIKKIRKEN